MSERAVCLVSGGMDSCVSAAIALSEGLQLGFLHVKYGQLTESRELKAFEEIADFYSVNSTATSLTSQSGSIFSTISSFMAKAN